MPFEKDPNEIGALWLHDGPRGEYMTGEINGEKVVCFRSKSASAKAPAWNVLKSKPKLVAERPMYDANKKPDALEDDIQF